MLPIFAQTLSLRSAARPRKPDWFQAVALLSTLSMALLGIATTGCGSTSNSAAKAGPISVAGTSSATAQAGALAASSTLKLSMMPTGDKVDAGVDWTVSCGGNPITGSVVNGACGTLAPAHTADGAATLYTAPAMVPINTAITITATVTSNPSQSSSVSMTIVALPIAVLLTQPQPVPSSLNVNQAITVIAQVTNDVAGAGVAWTATCGSSACGSFYPTQGLASIYTAPSVAPTGGTVTISATSLTDTTKSASITLTIVVPTTPPPVGVSISPASAYVQTTGAAHVVQFTAFVSNDPAAAGVDWSVSCGASICGGVNPTHTPSGATISYSAPSTVPPGGTVTITAKSTTDASASAFATANVMTAAPIIVAMSSPPPGALAVGSTASLAATVTSDPNNLGVDWTASCGSPGVCGGFSLSPAHTASGGQIVYTAPAVVPTGSAVTITASSPASTPANPAIATTTIVALPPSLSFAQAPPATMVSATQTPVSATVTHDVAPGGVAWTVQCNSILAGGCGWISPVQTASGATAVYTAPPVTAAGTAVTLVATSVADPSVSLPSNAIAIAPSTTLSVGFVPSLPSQVQPDGTVNLIAAVANDATAAGVDWEVCGSGCGFFTVKPAVAAIPATATTPYVPPIPAVTAITVSGWSNGLSIPYTAPSEPPASGGVVILASAHADSTKTSSGTIAIRASSTGPALNGIAQAGSQPIVGASVSLYAAGTSGYASASSQIATSATDKNGSFTVPAGYTCPSPGSQMYLVATKGKTGANATNPNLALMTALGSCGNLGSAPVVVNEVTSIASAFATAPFAANNALYGNSSYLYIGTSGSNLTGLANAFAAVNNLVDISTGQARFTTPAGNATTPYAEINTLADMLNTCTATSGGVEGDGSACSTLFTATDVLPQHALYNSIAPADTLQAAFNIAQRPVTNYGYQLDTSNPKQLLPLATTSSPFQPILTAQPNDWSLSLHYTGGGLSSANAVGSFAVDAAGNIWITDTAAGSVVEWNAVGAVLSPTYGFPAGGGPIAIDANGYVWISGNGSLTELTGVGSAAPGSPFKGAAIGGTDMAVDAGGNLWIAAGAGVEEFSNLGVAISPAGGFTNNGFTGITAVSVDSSNNVWLGGLSGYAELTNPGGDLIVAIKVGYAPVLPQIAADGTGNLWSITEVNGFLADLPPYVRGITYGFTAQFYPGGGSNGQGQSGPLGGLNFYNAEGIAVDGAGTAWVASQGGGTGPTIAPSVLPIVPSMLQNNLPNYLGSSSLAAGTLRAAVDGSGNVWVLLADNTATEFVGVATPAVTPIALALKSHKLGVKP